MLFSSRNSRSVPNESNIFIFVTGYDAELMWASFTNRMILSWFDQTRVCGFLYTLGAFWKWDCGCVGGFWYWAVRSVAFYRAETDARDSPDRKTLGLKSRAVYFFETTTNLRSFFNIKGMVHSLIVPNLCKFLSSVEHKIYIFWRMQVTKQLTVAIDLVFIRSFIRSVNIPTSIFIIIPVVKQKPALNQSSSCPYFSP